MSKSILCALVILCGGQAALSQSDSTSFNRSDYHSSSFYYLKPRPFQFITQIPRTFHNAAKETFNKRALPAIAVITVSSLLLIATDQFVLDEAHQFGRYIHLNNEKKYRTLVSFRLGKKVVPVYELPQNLNSALYSIGEGFTSVGVSAGMLAYGKIKKDNRALQTASEILQVQFMVGLTTQVIKRISGRESPSRASAPGGVWRPFPAFNTFTNNTSRYDAFPSGHLASLSSTLTVLVSNYPEKRWLKPTAYGLLGIVGFAMLNNDVHWAGDYPLALGIGYVCGKATVKLNRLVRQGGTNKTTRIYRRAHFFRNRW